MTALLRSLMQLSAAALLCGVLQSLCGKGAQREILRFGCACLMVILLLSQLRQIPAVPFPAALDPGLVQKEVEQAQKEARQALLKEAVYSLEQELNRQAAAQGLRCRAALRCTVSREGVLSVDSVTLYCAGNAYAQMALFRKNVADQLALPEAKITIQEESAE